MSYFDDDFVLDEPHGPEPERQPWEDEPAHLAVTDLSPAGTLTAEDRARTLLDRRESARNQWAADHDPGRS